MIIPGLLRNEYIVGVKRIYEVPTFEIDCDVDENEYLSIAKALADFRDRVARGDVIQFIYRDNIGKTPDRLLADDGIMHLHLGRSPLMRYNDDVILWASQFNDDSLYLLKVSGHGFPFASGLNKKFLLESVAKMRGLI